MEFNEVFPAHRMIFGATCDGWVHAIDTVAAPLVEDGCIEETYVKQIKESIAAGGTYIDLGFGVALAHARPEYGVKKTGIAGLWLNEPVLLNDDERHPIEVCICLAAADNTEHLEALKKLGGILSSPETRTIFVSATSAEDIKDIIEGDI